MAIKQKQVDFSVIANKLTDIEKRKLSKLLMPEHDQDGQVSIKAVQAFAYALQDAIPSDSPHSFAKSPKKKNYVTKDKPTIFPDTYKSKVLSNNAYKNLEVENDGLVTKDKLQNGITYKYVGTYEKVEYFAVVKEFSLTT